MLTLISPPRVAQLHIPPFSPQNLIQTSTTISVCIFTVVLSLYWVLGTVKAGFLLYTSPLIRLRQHFSQLKETGSKCCLKESLGWLTRRNRGTANTHRKNKLPETSFVFSWALLQSPEVWFFLDVCCRSTCQLLYFHPPYLFIKTQYNMAE